MEKDDYLALHICTQMLMFIVHPFPEAWEGKDLESATLPTVHLIMIAYLVRDKVNSVKH